MNQNDARYLELAEKWLNGSITPEEELEYAEWYNRHHTDEVLELDPHYASTRDEHRLKILQQINARRKHKFILRRRLVRFAAAILLLIAGGAIFWFFNQHKTSAPVISHDAQPVHNDIMPGKSGAILQLADGRTIILDTASNGNLASSSAANVIKSSDALSFLVKDGDQPALPEYNTLVTPRGRQQELQLADGSKVWLNAQSSIRFPSTFPGNFREVTITGEAYFEVAKNPQKPFIVHVNNSSIEVLGTHFNVMAYNNEPAMATTLLEGAIVFHSNNQNLILRPGQQSRLLSNGNLVLIPDADIDLAVAWKNGLQAFDQADLKTIMRQVGRWYNVDIDFVGELPSRTFSGGIPRSASLSQLLQLFKATNIHFKIDAENKKLTVIP